MEEGGDGEEGKFREMGVWAGKALSSSECVPHLDLGPSQASYLVISLMGSWVDPEICILNKSLWAKGKVTGSEEY